MMTADRNVRIQSISVQCVSLVEIQNLCCFGDKETLSRNPQAANAGSSLLLE